MASLSAGLVLKAAAVAAVLAMLVLPSSGRCPSLGPAPAPTLPPPAPTPSVPPPAPAPAPAPQVSCSDCYSDPKCESSCTASIPQKCNKQCNNPQGYCEECKADAIKKCTDSCTGSCDCDAAANDSCRLACSDGICTYCTYYEGRLCRYGCQARCNLLHCVYP